jgi:hypothetical protein
MGEPGTFQGEISPIISNKSEKYGNLTEKNPDEENEPLVAKKVFQIGKDNGMTEIYKYFRLKRDEEGTVEKDDIDDEDENEVEEIDCRDVS